MSPLVSVIIPTYNGTRYLAETVKSAINQTYSETEIIVVDDGSEEDIFRVLEPYSEYIKLFRIRNSGPAAARNFGIRNSKGKYIALLDHDDLWAPNNLEVCVSIMELHPNCGLVYSYPELIDENGTVIPNERPSYFPSGWVFKDFLLRNRITTFSCTLIRRKVFEEIGYLDESRKVMTCDDYNLWLRISLNYHVLFSEAVTVSYRIHPGNLAKNLNQNLSAHLVVFDRIIREALRKQVLNISEANEIVREHLLDRFRYFAFRYYYELGDYREARKLFARILLLRHINVETLVYYFLCLLPSWLRGSLKSLKKNLVKGWTILVKSQSR